MALRVVLVLVTAFWVVMNVLLWRSEFGGRETLSEIPLETVLDRVLNAPDPSVLQITHHGEPLGSLRWIPSVEENRPAVAEESSAAPEGLVDATGYNLDLDLSLMLGQAGPRGRSRLLAHVDLDTNHVWRALSVRVYQRPASWEITAKAGEDFVRLKYEEGQKTWDQQFRWKDVQKLSSALGPYAALLPAPLASQLGQVDPARWNPRIQWSAANDWIKIGRSRVRTYRVKLKFLERYEMVAHLSRAGEILRVRLPDGIVLSNESVPISGRAGSIP